MPTLGKEAAERNETGGSSFGCCPWIPMTAIHDKSPIEGLCHVRSTVSKSSRRYSAGGLYLRFSSRMAVPTSALFASSRAMMSCMTPGRTRRGSTPKLCASLLCHSRPYRALPAVSMSAGSNSNADSIFNSTCLFHSSSYRGWRSLHRGCRRSGAALWLSCPPLPT